MKRSRNTRSRLAVAMAVALSGGTLFGGCPTRFKEAVVSGVKDYLLNDLMSSVLGGGTYGQSYSVFDGF